MRPSRTGDLLEHEVGDVGSATTQIVDRLVDSGLVDRVPGQNRREVWAQINDSGRAVATRTLTDGVPTQELGRTSPAS